MSFLRLSLFILAFGVLIGGCSQQEDLSAPEHEKAVYGTNKDGTEFLGEIAIAAGSGFVEGGVGMVDTDTGTLDITVPADATVEQVLLYWVGGTTSTDGDNQIMVDGNSVTGAMIGGGTNFFGDYDFYGYRVDVTAKGWVVPGANSFEITDFDFDFTGGTLDENNGAGMIVIYNDGTLADLQLFDGLDMAFFKFSATLDATVPVTFDFLAESADRVGNLVVLAGSVGADRPNLIKVTTSAGEQVFDNPLGSTDGMLFDSINLDVDIPANDTQATVQLFSVVSEEPLGASLGWLGTGLSVPMTPPPATYCIGDLVWSDDNSNGCQDDGEMGMAGVTVNLWAGCPADSVIATVVTDADGMYKFCDLMAGEYTVQFESPDGYLFCEQNADGCSMELDSNAGIDGITDCVTIVDADDLTIDAGLCPVPVETYCIGDLVWSDDNSNGCQDDGEMGMAGVTVNLWSGCPAAEVIATMVTDANGMYKFCGLMAGEYTVQFESPDGYMFCEQFADGCSMELDSNAGSDGITDCVTIVDADDLTIDAGLCPIPELACLGDFVWNDMNMNGIQDVGEEGIAGVYVDLMDCNGQFLASTMTDDSGYYMFCELDAGDYNVQFVLPEGYVFSPQDQGGDDAVDSDADPLTGMTACTTLEPGENDLTWDAGMFMPEVVDCDDCDGKITELTMRYLGDTSAYIEVVTKGKKSMVIFEGTVDPNEEFSFVGNDKKGTMGTEISLYIDGALNTKIHTSCSVPIGIGMVSGAFEITAGASRNGGNLCPIDSPPPGGGDDCDNCEGKITELTLRYAGESGYVTVYTKGRDPEMLFGGNLNPGDELSIVGNDRKGTVGTEISLFVDEELNTKIHTSCSVPIYIGMVSGDFEITAGRSRNGGELCTMDEEFDSNLSTTKK